MKIDKEANKQEFISLLQSTKREGVDDVIKDLEDMGFFEAPASAGHHLNVEGGLVLHSLNVCKASLAVLDSMSKLDSSVALEVKRDHVIIAALLHDVCKADIYQRSVRKQRNRFTGNYEDIDAWKISYKKFPMGHGEKSVINLLCSGLVMFDDEMLAIRWHMGAFGLNFNSYEDERCYDTARMLYPLCSIIQAGDSLAASILERNAEDIDEL